MAALKNPMRKQKLEKEVSLFYYDTGDFKRRSKKELYVKCLGKLDFVLFMPDTLD